MEPKATEEETTLLTGYVERQYADSRNLATEQELVEQARLGYKAFSAADAAGDGELTITSIKKLCEALALPMERDEEEALAKMDNDGSGTLDVDEFLSWWLKRVGCSPNPAKQMEILARNTFKKFDKDQGGTLDCGELRLLFAELGATFTDNEMAEAVRELDADASGEVDEQEFIDWWTNRSLKKRKAGGLLALKLRKLANKAQELFSTDIFTAVWNGDAELVKLFVDGDARMTGACDVSEFGDGWTPLHYASYRGATQIVQCLLDAAPAKAALVNKQNDKGFTALFYAAQTSRLDICNLLLDAGADPCISGISGEFSDDFLVSLCPADLCVDFPELGESLRAHDKCLPPDAVPSESVEASLAGATGVLTIDVQCNSSVSAFLKTLSALPIRKWRIELDCSSNVIRPLSMKIPATVSPAGASREQLNYLTISTQIDKTWYRSVMAEKGDIDEIQFILQISPINALLDEGPLCEPVAVVFVPARRKAPEAAVPATEGFEDEKKDSAL